jgi:hypothetical protein
LVEPPAFEKAHGLPQIVGERQEAAVPGGPPMMVESSAELNQ